MIFMTSNLRKLLKLWECYAAKYFKLGLEEDIVLRYLYYQGLKKIETFNLEDQGIPVEFLKIQPKRQTRTVKNPTNFLALKILGVKGIRNIICLVVDTYTCIHASYKALCL